MTEPQTDPKTARLIEPTPLDQAHAAMMAAPEDDAARLRFYERIADVELFMLLEDEPQGDQISPVLLEDSYVMVFDRAARLSAHVGGGRAQSHRRRLTGVQACARKTYC